MSTTTPIVFAVLFVVFFALQWWRLRNQAAQSPEWREEMKATPWRDRRRIASAVRDGRRLDNPREARLAVGMAEEQRQVNRWISGFPGFRLIVGTGLLLLGLLAGELTVAALGGVFLLIGLAGRAYDNRLDLRLRRAEELNREQAGIEVGRPDQ